MKTLISKQGLGMNKLFLSLILFSANISAEESNSYVFDELCSAIENSDVATTQKMLSTNLLTIDELEHAYAMAYEIYQNNDHIVQQLMVVVQKLARLGCPATKLCIFGLAINDLCSGRLHSEYFEAKADFLSSVEYHQKQQPNPLSEREIKFFSGLKASTQFAGRQLLKMLAFGAINYGIDWVYNKLGTISVLERSRDICVHVELALRQKKLYPNSAVINLKV